jgi:hypothetical protein
MLKALGILAVFLVVGRAGAPSSRVTTDPKAGSIAEKNDETQTDKQPPIRHLSLANSQLEMAAITQIPPKTARTVWVRLLSSRTVCRCCRNLRYHLRGIDLWEADQANQNCGGCSRVLSGWPTIIMELRTADCNRPRNAVC